jgi:hypothetical protein
MVETSDSKYKLLDSVKLIKSIDRILKIQDDRFAVFSYHYNKQEKTKTSTVVIVEVSDDDKIKVVSETSEQPYGVFSATRDKETEFTIACSDSSVKVANLDESG